MKKALLILPLALALTLFPLSEGPQAAAARPDLEKRVAELEESLAREVDEHRQTRELLEATLGYLHGQAKGAKGMLSTLDRSESLGFTKGINFQSREVLLSGFRDYWSTLDDGLPAVPKKKKTAPAGVPGRRR